MDPLKAEPSKSLITAKDNGVKALEHVDQVEPRDLDWVSDRDYEKLKSLPWPDENESKE